MAEKRGAKAGSKTSKASAKAAPAAPEVKEAKAGGEKSEKIAKTQIIERLSEKTTLNKKQASEAVAAMLDIVAESLKGGKSVGLPGLGTFSVAQTAERQGVRPGTNERITIPAGKKVRFKVASTLKSSLGLTDTASE
ncbi:HU family DNA-binding protein [Deinococcus yavapaiensis]|uniref:DNA-binding protein HU-beta n=1 Tax=Deinococcus yavapaiensis KR-236 TaxID=694435 RepID=A0A318S3S3_9DEIO|nr:HU family DNA-binding protein [Deinococcus yavapaiensis]PYE51097.1 DNA-binding protein HU-beta [Deinococcus yavapaiensis KR-236]